MRWRVWFGATVGLLLTPATAHAVIGGHEPTREYPWFAHIQRIANAQADDTGCGGSLVSPRWVLTAGHCLLKRLDGTVDPIDPSEIRIMFGRTRRHVPPPFEFRGARRVIVHPDFKPYGDHLAPAGGPDLGLVELPEAVDFEPIAIASRNDRHRWLPGTESTVIGFGLTETTPFDLVLPPDPARSSDVLVEAQSPIVSDDDCAISWAVGGKPVGFAFDPSTMLCTGYPQGGVGPCTWDSGGPVMVRGPGSSMRLVGVVSFGPCAYPLLYEVHARPAEPALRDWVLSTINR